MNDGASSRTTEFDVRAPIYDTYTRWLTDPGLTDAIRSSTEGLGYGGICVDLCGGTGRLAIEDASAMRRQWVVVDGSEAMLNASTASGTDVPPRCAAWAERLPFRSDAVRLVAIRSALDYLDIEHALGEVRRILTDEGHLVVVQRTSDLYEGHLSWHRRLQRLRSPHKARPMAAADVQRAIEEAGFRVLSSTRVDTQALYAFDEWVARDGTIPPDRAEQIRRVVTDLPPQLSEDTGFVVDGRGILAPASWLVVTASLREPDRRLVPLVAAALVTRWDAGGPRVLLQRRRTEPEYWQWWELPQGHVRAGESVEEAALRELGEETGLVGRVTDEARPALRMSEGRRALDAALLDSTQDGRSEYVAVGIDVERVGGELHADTAQDFTWFTVPEVTALLCRHEGVFPLDVPLLRAWVDRCRVSGGG